MEPESLYNLLQLPGRVNQAAGVTLSQGAVPAGDGGRICIVRTEQAVLGTALLC